MVIDTSAIVAILFNEPEAAWFESCISEEAIPYMSAASFVETSMVLGRHFGNEAAAEMDRYILRMKIEIVPVSLEQAIAAREAFRKYGRGRHKAGLNFGDCFTYALAKVSGEPLLYKGNDFTLTDLALISPPPSPQNT